MIVSIQYRIPGNETCSVVTCVEMTTEEFARYRHRLTRGDHPEDVAEDAERKHPTAHRKHWKFAQERIHA